MKKLFIVESMSKGRTIQRMLGDDYKVVASSGHVRDLPIRRMGVKMGGDYAIEYEDTRKAKIAEILKLCNDANIVYLSTDPDREGEAIAWHLHNIIRSKFKTLPMHRVSTNEITKAGIEKALSHPRDVNQSIVEAQQARRAIDRLVGYSLGDSLNVLLNQKKRITSGRVQCAVLKLVDDHNRSIDGFTPKPLGWSITINGVLGMCNKDGDALLVKTKAGAAKLVEMLATSKLGIVGQTTTDTPIRAPVPFTTAALQREAYWRLGFPISKTMSVAQRLYEGGYITYLRTDSPRISRSGAEKIKDIVVERFGTGQHDYNLWSSKGGAHEAIRPTKFTSIHTKSNDMASLYKLIYDRSVASQMKPATLQVTKTIYQHAASKLFFCIDVHRVASPSFLAFYKTTKVPLEKNTDAALGDVIRVDAIMGKLEKDAPPRHLSEGSLVKKMEMSGIGRPSTFVSIMGKLFGKGMLVKAEVKRVVEEVTISPGRAKEVKIVREEKETGCLILTNFGKQVLSHIVQNYSQLADVRFTAEMEQALDKVSEGAVRYVDIMDFFWRDFAAAHSNVVKKK